MLWIFLNKFFFLLQYIFLHSRWFDISREIVLPQMTISSSAGATISIKKFLPRHRRRRQATSPFIAEGDPSFLRIRSCGTLLLSKEVHANDPAARDSSSLSKLPVIPDAEVFHRFSLISRYALVTRSPCLFVCPLVRTFTIDRRHSHSYAFIFTRVTRDMQFKKKMTSNFILPAVFPVQIFSW